MQKKPPFPTLHKHLLMVKDILTGQLLELLLILQNALKGYE